MNRHLAYLYNTVQICTLMEKENGSKQLTLKHLDGKAEAKEFKGFFFQMEKKKRVKKKPSQKLVHWKHM